MRPTCWIYDPSKGKEREVIEALHRWGARRIFRGAWVIEFDSTADLARRALIAVGGAITCAVVEIKPNGDHAEPERVKQALEHLVAEAPPHEVAHADVLADIERR